jgi:hypothetical protein
MTSAAAAQLRIAQRRREVVLDPEAPLQAWAITTELIAWTAWASEQAGLN